MLKMLLEWFLEYLNVTFLIYFEALIHVHKDNTKLLLLCRWTVSLYYSRKQSEGLLLVFQFQFIYHKT